MSQAERHKSGLPKFRFSFGVWMGGGVVIAVLAGLTAPLAIRQVQAWGILSESPRLEISKTEIDLGEGAPNEIVRGSLQLRNTGVAPLEFSIERSCGCTELHPSEGKIPPGKAVTIALGVRLSGHAGSEKNVSITINSNDPERLGVRCAVRARCPTPFEVEPEFVEFGKVVPEDVASQIADIHVHRERQEQGRLRSRLESKSFVASIERDGLVRIRPAGSLDFGDHYGSLELFLEGADEKLIRVPVHMYVTPPLSVVPSTLILRKDSAGRLRPVTPFVISSGSSPLGKVHVVNAPHEARIEELDRIDDHRWRYRLTIEEGWDLPEQFVVELEDLASGHRCKLTIVRASPQISGVTPK